MAVDKEGPSLLPGEVGGVGGSTPSRRRFESTGIVESLADTSRKVVAWFDRCLPDDYYTDISPDTQLSHLRALVAVKSSNLPPDLRISSEDDDTLTFIKSEDYVGLLADLVHQLPANRTLRSAKIYTAKDGSMVLDVFSFGDMRLFNPASKAEASKKDEILEYIRLTMPEHAQEKALQAMEGYLGRCDADYVLTVQPADCVRHCEMVYILWGGSDVRLEVGEGSESSSQGTQQEHEPIPANDDVYGMFLSRGDDDVMDFSAAALDTLSLAPSMAPTKIGGTLTVAVSNPRHSAFEQCCRFLSRHHVDIAAAHLYRVQPLPGVRGTPTLLMTFGVGIGEGQRTGGDGRSGDGLLAGEGVGEVLTESVLSELRHLQWVDNTVMRWLDDSANGVEAGLGGSMPVGHLEIVSLLVNCVHAMFVVRGGKRSWSTGFTLESILGLVEKHADLAQHIVDLFVARFDPDVLVPMTDQAFAERTASLREEIDAHLQWPDSRYVFQRLVDIVSCTLKTNFFVPTRQVPCIRLDPAPLAQPAELGAEGSGVDVPAPYAVYFAHGREMSGFHVRYSHVARGLLRVVTASTHDHHTWQHQTLYLEACRLAWGQHLKNKDVVEGGAVGLLVVSAPMSSSTRGAHTDHGATVQHCTRAFLDALLDLTWGCALQLNKGRARQAPGSPPPIGSDTFALLGLKLGREGSLPAHSSSHRIVDYYGQPEYLALDPGDAVSDGTVAWAVARAAYRGHPRPYSILSSAPETRVCGRGYELASSNVLSLLQHAVTCTPLHVHASQRPLTIKLCGGPAHPLVAQLLPKLLGQVEWAPKGLRLVGISDGSGVCEDMLGLDSDELLRLAASALPVANFSPAFLHFNGSVVSVHDRDGLRLRNSMLHRLSADITIAADGKPHTLSAESVPQYMRTVTPHTPHIILEVMDSFVEPQAARQLGQCAVVVVPSLACTKAVAMAHSMQALLAMCMRPKEIGQHREQLQADISRRVEEAVVAEARLLFSEYAVGAGGNCGRSSNEQRQGLYELCVHVGETINSAVASILQSVTLSTALPPQVYERILYDSLPKSLRDLPDFAERLQSMPEAYLARLVVNRLAATMVYREGLAFVQHMDAPTLGRACIAYVLQDHETDNLVAALRQALTSTTQGNQSLDADTLDRAVELMRLACGKKVLLAIQAQK